MCHCRRSFYCATKILNLLQLLVVLHPCGCWCGYSYPNVSSLLPCIHFTTCCCSRVGIVWLVLPLRLLGFLLSCREIEINVCVNASKLSLFLFRWRCFLNVFASDKCQLEKKFNYIKPSRKRNKQRQQQVALLYRHRLEGISRESLSVSLFVFSSFCEEDKDKLESKWEGMPVGNWDWG